MNVICSILRAPSKRSPLNAGCGSCAADKNRTSKAFIEMVPSNGKVDGKTFASCGMCNFDTNDRSCGLFRGICMELAFLLLALFPKL